MCVSIVVPAYNSEKFLFTTLESVLAQTVSDWELVVVNDGSTDQTGTIAETFARLDNRIRVVHQANAGIAQARNRGFAETRADCEYFMLLDHDDILEPDGLEILINTLKINPGAVAAHGMVRHIDSKGQPFAITGHYTHPVRRRGIRGKWLKIWSVTAPTTFAVLAYGNCISTSEVMMRRAIKMVVGDFDPNSVPHDDWDMWLRLSRLGDIVFINRVIYAWRIHGGNTSRHHELMRQSELYVRKKMYNAADLDEHEKRIIQMGFRYHELYRALNRLSYAARNLKKGRWIDTIKQLQLATGYILSSIEGLSQG